MNDKQDSCSHTEKIQGYWQPQSQISGVKYDDDDYFHDEWIEGYDKPTTIDIDIHHYKCTQCRKIMRY